MDRLFLQTIETLMYPQGRHHSAHIDEDEKDKPKNHSRRKKTKKREKKEKEKHKHKHKHKHNSKPINEYNENEIEEKFNKFREEMIHRTDFLGNQVQMINQFFFKKDYLL